LTVPIQPSKRGLSSSTTRAGPERAGRRIIIAAALVLATGCNKSNRGQENIGDGRASQIGARRGHQSAAGPSRGRYAHCSSRHKALAYGTQDKRQQLDLYYPRASHVTSLPVVAWIHGGGWAGGSRDSVDRFALREACRGYAVASIGYRASREARFPAQILDVRAALAYLKRHHRKLGIDGGRIAVWGASAGGHLAALLGTTAEVSSFTRGQRQATRQAYCVEGVVAWWAPMDFLRMANTFPVGCRSRRCPQCPGSPESRLLGCTIDRCPQLARRASPLSYVDAHDAPFLIQHGAQDCTVPGIQARLMRDALRDAGVPVSYQLLPRARHGDASWSSPEVLDEVDSFLDARLLGHRLRCRS